MVIVKKCFFVFFCNLNIFYNQLLVLKFCIWLRCSIFTFCKKIKFANNSLFANTNSHKLEGKKQSPFVCHEQTQRFSMFAKEWSWHEESIPCMIWILIRLQDSFTLTFFRNAVFVSLFRKFVLYLRRKKVAPVFYISIQ